MRKGMDFLVRSPTQTVRRDIRHSVMVSHENNVVSGMILHDPALLSAVEKARFWSLRG